MPDKLFCPYCKESLAQVKEVNVGQPFYVVECPICGASGPLGDVYVVTPEAAEKAWKEVAQPIQTSAPHFHTVLYYNAGYRALYIVLHARDNQDAIQQVREGQGFDDNADLSVVDQGTLRDITNIWSEG